MKKIIYTITAIIFSQVLLAQVVTTDPEFPTADASVIIYFHADLGNKGLQDYTSDVYAHLGVITNLSEDPSDWRYVKTGWSENTAANKMTRVSANLYSLELTPSICGYFGVPDAEEIQQMAFVFRNSDGTKTGREADGGDIFAPVYAAGVNLNISSPENNTIFEVDENFAINANSSNADSLKIFIDDVLIHKVEDQTIFYLHSDNQIGRHKIKVIAKNTSGQISDSVYYSIRGSVNVADLPDGWRPGINYLGSDTVGLVLLAPQKEYVYVVGDFNNWEPNDDYFMNRTPDGEMFWLGVGDLVSGQEYIFQYFIDGKILIADPFADKLSDPDNDQWIEASTYPGLIEYPSDETTEVASVLQTNQTAYQWQTTNFTPPAKTDMVIYELLVRDFIAAHDFETMIDTIAYLDSLGVNAIELMPINEFEGNESWGYNPSFYFAPDKYYGPKNKLKEFIDTCHNRGIAVIIDMVLNHSYGQSPLVRMYYNSATYQPTADNPWFNVTSPNTAFSWGYDFNHESQYTKDFVDSVNAYWLTEYKVDGFRFDFTKGFTNTAGDGGAYDASRIAILKRMADELWSVNPNAYVILEHFAANSEETELSNYGMMLWGNLNNEYCEGAMGYASDFSWGSYKARGWSNPHLVSYMESHDEERVMYKNIIYGNSSGSYNITQQATALRRLELNAAFFFTIPGPKMIWQFGELGYDYSIEYDCRVCNKPIRWDYFQDANRKQVYRVYQALIGLKKEYDVFRTTDYLIDVDGTMKSIHLNNQDINVLVLGNFGVTQNTIDPAFQSTGDWHEFFTGDVLTVTDVNALISLNPGEYRLYSTQSLGDPIFTGIEELPVVYNELELFPNPAVSEININLSAITEQIKQLVIYNVAGQVVEQKDFNGFLDNLYTINVSAYPNGFYYYRIVTDKVIYSGKFIKN